MGRNVEKTFVGAYIKLGTKTHKQVEEAFKKSEYNEEFDGYFFDYIREKIDPLNDESLLSVLCPPEPEAQIFGEITLEAMQSVRDFVETKYAVEIAFLRTIFGTADVIVGVFDYETEVG
jgi:hypothetical protein